jgi:hypothetical protein
MNPNFSKVFDGQFKNKARRGAGDSGGARRASRLARLTRCAAAR